MMYFVIFISVILALFKIIFCVFIFSVIYYLFYYVLLFILSVIECAFEIMIVFQKQLFLIVFILVSNSTDIYCSLMFI